MGVLADFIVGTEAEAVGYGGEPSFPDSHKAQHKRFTEVELGSLYGIAQGMEVDDETCHDFTVVSVQNDGESFTTELLADLVSRLAAASDSQLISWADSWGRTEEIQCEGKEILPVLGDLRRLSKLAEAESKKVYLWNCV